MDPEIGRLESLAFRAWPAAQVVEQGPWRLRHTHGVTRRANSVWLGSGPALPSSLPVALARVEAFYARHGLPARYQVSPVAGADVLDRELAARGYLIDSPVSIQTASVDRVLSALSRPLDINVVVDVRPAAPWFEISAYRGRYARVSEVYRGILERIGARAGYALAEIAQQPVAVGLGVCEGTHAGVFSMLTLADHRRKGAGLAVLRALAQWARSRGARTLYLQVERNNQNALALYASAGFQERYGYHYRVAAVSTGTVC